MVLFNILNIISVIKSLKICENSRTSYIDNRDLIFLENLPKSLRLYWKNLSDLTFRVLVQIFYK